MSSLLGKCDVVFLTSAVASRDLLGAMRPNSVLVAVCGGEGELEADQLLLAMKVIKKIFGPFGSLWFRCC